MKQPLQASSDFIPHLHAFRGFAIINICFIHAWVVAIYYVKPSAPNTDADKIQGAINAALFHSSTLYFTIISGILFSMILSKRPWKKFFVTKIQNVVFPYLFITLIYSLAIWPTVPGQPIELNVAGDFASFVSIVVDNVITGKAMFHLWYIPVLVILFLCTPIIMFLVRRPSMIWIVILLVAAPLVVSRTDGLNIDIPTVSYFLGAYTMGVYLGAHYANKIEWFERNIWSLVLIVVVLTIALTYCYLIDFHKIGYISLTETMHYIHKTIVAGIALVLLKRWELSLPSWLMKLGDYSFSIYFIHAIFLYGLYVLMNNLLLEPPNAVFTFILGIVFFIVSVVGSIVMASLFQSLLKKKSRYLVGV
jgi:peptidoglycan/LPS O-acetylase OafA/YrhL